VRLVAHRQRQLDLRLADREPHPLAVVLDGDDVGPLLGDELEQLDQLARTVAEPRSDDEEAPACVSPWRITWISSVGSMLPAREQDADLVLAARLAGEHGRDRRAPAPSTSSFVRSSRSTIAWLIWSSVTVTTSSRRRSGLPTSALPAA
jgi:hypothetical protein